MPDAHTFDSISDAIRRQFGVLSASRQQEEEQRAEREAKVKADAFIAAINKVEQKIKKMDDKLTDEQKRHIYESIQQALKNKIKEQIGKELQSTFPGKRKLPSSSVSEIRLPEKKMKVIGYIVPRGTVILVPSRRLSAAVLDQSKFRGMHIRPSDFDLVLSTKEVRYAPEDVCLNPHTSKCTLDGLAESLYAIGDDKYYGFLLPHNAKGAPFILVHEPKVKLVRDDAFDPNELRQFIDQVLKVAPTNQLPLVP